jgi:hypothetical protein
MEHFSLAVDLVHRKSESPDDIAHMGQHEPTRRTLEGALFVLINPG